MLLCFIGYSFADNAFGSYRGMTREELEKKGVKLELNWTGYSYTSNNAPIKNEYFDKYKYAFDKSGGLCTVTGITFMHHQEKDVDLAAIFDKELNSLMSLLSKEYGVPIIINNTSTNANNAEWIVVLSENKISSAQNYARVWSNETNNLGKNIDRIVLRPIVLPPYNDRYSGLLMLEYYYKNCSVEQE